MFKAKEVSLVDTIRAIQKADKANKQCANCADLGPVYICTDFMTFVCTECSGVHRELSHKVKSISMSNWNRDEISELESRGGNTRDHRIFMATYDPKLFPVPQSTNRTRLREFVKAKYIERRWTNSNETGREPVLRSNQTESPIVSSGKSIKELPKPTVPEDDLFSFNKSSRAQTIESESKNVESHVSPSHISHMFEKCIVNLNLLNSVDPAEARALVTSFVSKLRKHFPENKERLEDSTLLSEPTVPKSVAVDVAQPAPSVNPFDFFPTLLPQQVPAQSLIGQQSGMVNLTPPASLGPSWVPSSSQTAQPVRRVEVVPNPFDDLI